MVIKCDLNILLVNSLDCISCRSDELTECSTLRFTPFGNVTQLPTVTCEVGQVECETRVSDGKRG